MDTLKLIAAAVILVVGAVVGWSGGHLYASIVSIPAARSEGESAGRAASDAAWQRKLDDAKAAAEAQRVVTQGRIDGIERSYLKQLGDNAAQMSALEAQLQQERNDDATEPPTSSPGAAGACRPALSRGVRDQLARIGVAASRDDPAKPEAALPGRH